MLFPFHPTLSVGSEHGRRARAGLVRYAFNGLMLYSLSCEAPGLRPCPWNSWYMGNASACVCYKAPLYEMRCGKRHLFGRKVQARRRAGGPLSQESRGATRALAPVGPVPLPTQRWAGGGEEPPKDLLKGGAFGLGNELPR